MLKKYVRRVEDDHPTTEKCYLCIVDDVGTKLRSVCDIELIGESFDFYLNVNPELSEEKVVELTKLMTEFTDVFSDVPGKTQTVIHDIKLTTDMPIHKKPYHILHNFFKAFDEEVDRITAASDIGLGAVLLQMIEGILMPVSYGSKSPLDREKSSNTMTITSASAPRQSHQQQDNDNHTSSSTTTITQEAALRQSQEQQHHDNHTSSNSTTTLTLAASAAEPRHSHYSTTTITAAPIIIEAAAPRQSHRQQHHDNHTSSSTKTITPAAVTPADATITPGNHTRQSHQQQSPRQSHQQQHHDNHTGSSTDNHQPAITHNTITPAAAPTITPAATTTITPAAEPR
ncbi:protein P54-like [Homarus americanus]|uniref:protein P54-like n=1 Tax=Homarus americanus TaxID=6706 RepID=UPI001C440C0B|nr:protein P54-like [Homarus americanus]